MARPRNRFRNNTVKHRLNNDTMFSVNQEFIRFEYAGDKDHHGNHKPKNISVSYEPLVWSVRLQARAVEAGFFLHRSENNRVNIIGVDKFSTEFPRAIPGTDDWLRNCHQCLQSLERGAFEKQNTDGDIYRIALRFIVKQDKFEYVGAWDHNCQFFTWPMLWYRRYRLLSKPKRYMSDRDITEQTRLIDQMRRSNNLHIHAHTARIRRRITDA